MTDVAGGGEKSAVGDKGSGEDESREKEENGNIHY